MVLDLHDARSSGDETPLFEITGLNKKYASFELKNISLTMASGTVVGLLGRNGAGKSTLIKCALGLVRPDSGRIKFRGRLINPDVLAWRQKVGYVAEQHPLYDSMLVEEFLRFISSYYSSWDEEYCRKLMRRLSLDGGRRIGELSHGTRIKVALVSALSYKPSLLILDEPTSGLDPIVRTEFLRELQTELREQKSIESVLISSHILDDVSEVATHLALLRDGKLVLNSPADSLHSSWRVFSFSVPSANNQRQQLLSKYRIAKDMNNRNLLLCSIAEEKQAERDLQNSGCEIFEKRSPTLREMFVLLA